MPMLPAGPAWVALHPTSRSVEDLVEPFRRSVRRFLAELNARGCAVHITATRRPAERAWLMHWAWRIAREGYDPGLVPPRDPPIPIVWSTEGARQMVEGYGMAHRAALTSRHIDGRAIDMRISGWGGTPEELYSLGATFGVMKLRSDPPHWSDDGR